MPHTPEVFLRDLEKASDDAENAFALALTSYLAVHSDEDEEDDGSLLFWLSAIVPGFAVLVLDAMESYSPSDPLSEQDRSRIVAEAVRTALIAFRRAGQTDPRLLSGSGDVDRATRIRHVAVSVISAIRSDVQQSSAELLGFALKTWRTRLDRKVRTAHRLLEGRTVPVGSDFVTLGGRIRYPGDPTAHPTLTINCRCLLSFSTMGNRLAA